MTYDIQMLRAPRLAGRALATAVRLLENPATRPLVSGRLMASTGVTRFRDTPLSAPVSPAPPLPRPRPQMSEEDRSFTGSLDELVAHPPTGPGFRFPSIADFARAYRDGATDPGAVADRVLAAIQQSDAADPPLRAMIAVNPADVRAQAEASAARHRAGRSLGPFDGVPVAVKDEFDVMGYPTTAGMRSVTTIARSDATIAGRLRRAGAVLIGKANMHEIGIDTLGFNVHHGSPRNPYDPSRYPGGSSSGSAVAVAAGLCPVAVSADGGGSIRIPSALCGVVGLKSTWSRVSVAGAFTLGWSIAHAGAIAATARDAALAYAVMAGPDPRDPTTWGQPLPDLDGVGAPDIGGLRIGVFDPWFEDADPAVVATARELIAGLEARGARVVPVEVEHLELGRVAHGVAILSEMATALEGQGVSLRDLSLPSRVTLAVGRQLTGRDYVRAQQARTLLYQALERALQNADVVVTPTTALVAPPIPADALSRGESDLETTSGLMRYIFLANLTGHPAISVPAGYDDRGMPVGLQAIGRPWAESTLLRLAAVAEQVVERQPPRVFYRLLD
jgi:Asp-tRNA(Asn)/Glu-tRNA(Gln) amidotransferase A subunit family amidase